MGTALGMLRKFYKPIEQQVGKKVSVVYRLMGKLKKPRTYILQGTLIKFINDPSVDYLNPKLLIKLDGSKEILVHATDDDYFEFDKKVMNKKNWEGFPLLWELFNAEGEEVFIDEANIEGFMGLKPKRIVVDSPIKGENVVIGYE